MFTMIYALLVGLVAGLIADYLRKDQSYGLVVNTIIGVAGAGLGWWLNNNVLKLAEKGNVLVDVLVALVGASILLAIISFFKKRA